MNLNTQTPKHSLKDPVLKMVEMEICEKIEFTNRLTKKFWSLVSNLTSLSETQCSISHDLFNFPHCLGMSNWTYSLVTTNEKIRANCSEINNQIIYWCINKLSSSWEEMDKIKNLIFSVDQEKTDIDEKISQLTAESNKKRKKCCERKIFENKQENEKNDSKANVCATGKNLKVQRKMRRMAKRKTKGKIVQEGDLEEMDTEKIEELLILMKKKSDFVESNKVKLLTCIEVFRVKFLRMVKDVINMFSRLQDKLYCTNDFYMNQMCEVMDGYAVDELKRLRKEGCSHNLINGLICGTDADRLDETVFDQISRLAESFSGETEDYSESHLCHDLENINFSNNESSDNQLEEEIFDPKMFQLWEFDGNERRDIHSLLCTLHFVLWPEAQNQWKPIDLLNIRSKNNLESAYRRSLFLLDPLHYKEQPDHLHLAQRIRAAINSAWETFKCLRSKNRSK